MATTDSNKSQEPYDGTGPKISWTMARAEKEYFQHTNQDTLVWQHQPYCKNNGAVECEQCPILAGQNHPIVENRQLYNYQTVCAIKLRSNPRASPFL